jgi:hypothetical protein
MPRRFERHKRDGWSWGALPPRSAEVREAASTDPEPAKRAPARKDPARCKANRSRPHMHRLVLPSNPLGKTANTCRWEPAWNRDARGYAVRWSCEHKEICTVLGCGKVFRGRWTLRDGECPAYPGSEEQRQAAEAEMAKMNEGFARRRLLRKPVILGPQGFRRKRDST